MREVPALINKWLIAIHRYLQQLNIWLQRRSNQYSIKKKKIFLCIFCIMSVLICCFIIYSTIHNQTSTWLFAAPIRVIPLPKDALQKTSISVNEFHRLNAYKAYVDSLQSIYKKNGDSVLCRYVSKMQDTINLLQNLYYEQQSKNK